MGAAEWETKSVVRAAQRTQSDPGGGPADRLFVPETVCSQVLQWGRASTLICHPGFQRTL